MKLIVALVLSLLVACSSIDHYVPDRDSIDASGLPIPNVTLSIPNLRSCTDSGIDTVRINSASPVTVLVHGCKGSAGRFRSLAQLYAFHGQQAICFSYNDRDSLEGSAQSLVTSLSELSKVTGQQRISILGHSMGGLVARKALESTPNLTSTLSDKNLELITVSAPFSGIRAANRCGVKALHWLTLGIVPFICKMITGDNWYEITSSSEFITHPQPLLPAVGRYLKVVTNEVNTCRRKEADGSCRESDYIFDITEQYHPVIDLYPNLVNVEVEAGHVEIVGDESMAPRKLIEILQQHGMLVYTDPSRRTALEDLLASLY